MDDVDSFYYTDFSSIRLKQKLATMAHMEDVRELARLQYATASAEVKCKAVKLFGLMDSDGNGKVDIQELWSFFVEHDLPSHFRNLKFWTLLDSDGSGALSFDEVRTLIYIITTGCHSCSNCSNFIADANFFSCPNCPTFHLCINCFRDAQLSYHVHYGRNVHFLDTTAYLQTVRSRQRPPSPPVDYGSQQIGTTSRSLFVREKMSKTEVATEVVKKTGELLKELGQQALEALKEQDTRDAALELLREAAAAGSSCRIM